MLRNCLAERPGHVAVTSLFDVGRHDFRRTTSLEFERPEPIEGGDVEAALSRKRFRKVIEGDLGSVVDETWGYDPMPELDSVVPIDVRDPLKKTGSDAINGRCRDQGTRCIPVWQLKFGGSMVQHYV